MIRRPLRFLAAAAGVAALLAGAFGLERVFLLEREEALDVLARHEAALRSFAVKDLLQRCRDELEARRPLLETALRDPLVDGSELLFVEAGRQRLPRQFTFLDAGTTNARDLYRRLMSGELPTVDLDEDDPWSERLRFFATFRDALENGSRSAIERSFRAILTHRARFVVDRGNDLTYMVALLDLLEEKSDADPSLMESILRNGLTDSRGARTPGLQSQLLAGRERLSRDDFVFLADRISELSEGGGVQHGDFRDRLAEGSATTIELPRAVRLPMLLERGAWYVEPTESGAIEGVAVDLPALVAHTRKEMRDRGLLDEDDGLTLPELSAEPQPISSFRLTLDSPRGARNRSTIEGRFWLKTALAVTVLALVGAASVLKTAWTRRERQLLALKSDFVATVSHELRTPLASMRLMAETLERRLTGIDLARDYPRRLIREIDSLSFMVENILGFHRLEKGRWEPRVEDVRLSEIVRMLQQELPESTHARVAVRFEGENDLVFRADPELARLLFLNLGTNACKYNEADPVMIHIEGEVGETTLVRMSDNGVGIPGDQIEKVFSEFYRADGRGHGFGLGLAICRRIMELHAGQIRVADSSTNGTVFEMSFP